MYSLTLFIVLDSKKPVIDCGCFTDIGTKIPDSIISMFLCG